MMNLSETQKKVNDRYAYEVRTENSTIFTNDVVIKENYIWVEEEKTLYRIIKEDEGEVQPNAIVTSNKSEIKACRVSTFKSAEDAFGTMEYNTKVVEMALESIKESLDKKIEENESLNESLDEPKTYVANYLFNYFGGDQVDGKIITGAGIDVAIRPYKDGKLVKFRNEKETYFALKEPSRLIGERTRTIYLTSAVSVSFDLNNLFKINVDDSIVKKICDHFGWDTITVEAVDFELDYAESEWVSAPWSCGREIFEKFIVEHLDDFNIPDNIHAQSPSYSWLNE